MSCPGDKFKCKLESFNSIDRDESFLTIWLQDTEMLETLAARVEETGLGYLRGDSTAQRWDGAQRDTTIAHSLAKPLILEGIDTS
jgi:hypothetical protein